MTQREKSWSRWHTNVPPCFPLSTKGSWNCFKICLVLKLFKIHHWSKFSFESVLYGSSFMRRWLLRCNIYGGKMKKWTLKDRSALFKWNVMPLIRWGSIFFLFIDFYLKGIYCPLQGYLGTFKDYTLFTLLIWVNTNW